MLKWYFIKPPSFRHLQVSDFSSNLNYPSFIVYTRHDETPGQISRIVCTCTYPGFEALARLVGVGPCLMYLSVFGISTTEALNIGEIETRKGNKSFPSFKYYMIQESLRTSIAGKVLMIRQIGYILNYFSLRLLLESLFCCV